MIFDFLSDSEISEMLTPFPPPDNVTKTVSPWRKATRQMLIGFALMAGEPSTTEFNPDVFSLRRITLAPIVCMIGFFGMIIAIMKK